MSDKVVMWADKDAKDWYTLGVRNSKGGLSPWFSCIADGFTDCGLVPPGGFPIQGGYPVEFYVTVSKETPDA